MPDAPPPLPEFQHLWEVVAGAISAVMAGFLLVWRYVKVLPRRRKREGEEDMSDNGPPTGEFRAYSPEMVAWQDVQRRIEDLSKAATRNEADHQRIERSQDMTQDLVRAGREETLLLRQEIRYLSDAIKDLATRNAQAIATLTDRNDEALRNLAEAVRRGSKA